MEQGCGRRRASALRRVRRPRRRRAAAGVGVAAERGRRGAGVGAQADAAPLRQRLLAQLLAELRVPVQRPSPSAPSSRRRRRAARCCRRIFSVCSRCPALLLRPDRLLFSLDFLHLMFGHGVGLLRRIFLTLCESARLPWEPRRAFAMTAACCELCEVRSSPPPSGAAPRPRRFVDSEVFLVCTDDAIGAARARRRIGRTWRPRGSAATNARLARRHRWLAARRPTCAPLLRSTAKGAGAVSADRRAALSRTAACTTDLKDKWVNILKKDGRMPRLLRRRHHNCAGGTCVRRLPPPVPAASTPSRRLQHQRRRARVPRPRKVLVRAVRLRKPAPAPAPAPRAWPADVIRVCRMCKEAAPVVTSMEAPARRDVRMRRCTRTWCGDCLDGADDDADRLLEHLPTDACPATNSSRCRCQCRLWPRGSSGRRDSVSVRLAKWRTTAPRAGQSTTLQTARTTTTRMMRRVSDHSN